MRAVYKPLLLVVTAFNVFLFVSLFGHQGEGRPMLASLATAEQSQYKLSQLGLLQRVVARIGSDYVDPERIKPDKMLEKAFERMQREIPELMFEPNLDFTRLTVTVGGQRTTLETRPVTDLAEVVGLLKRSLVFVEQNLKSDKPMQEVEYAAINGILSTLDPHSVLLPPEAAREMDVQIQGEFGGLGITISLRGDDNILTVISTLPDTPAARAGLKGGDQILQIEDESTINMSLNEAVSKLRGLVGTPVTILLSRKEWEQPRSMTLLRETIKIEATTHEWLGQGIGYVHLKTFQHNSSSDLREALEGFRAEHGEVKGLVLDLRNNPGGPLEQAIEVSDMFLNDGVIVETVRAFGRNSEERKATMRGTEDPYPVVVLVDAESASASEIVAGALKNRDRAIVVGDQTFGKGSVQNLYPYPDDAKLKMTIAKYLTPGHKSIQSVGIVPDIQFVPVFADKEHTVFYASSGAFREKDLDSHFEESAELVKAEKPAEVIRYFSPGDFDFHRDDEKKKDEVVEPKKPDPKTDTQVVFAKELILKAGKGTRSGMLSAARSVLKSYRDEKESEIQRQLGALGVDWSAGRSANATLVADVKVTGAGTPLKAGEEVQVALTVTNKGSGTAYRVRAITACELGTFQDVELLIGKLEPGASKTVTRAIKLPPNLFSMAEQLKVKLFESAETPAGEVATLFTVQERPQPSFAYSLAIVDDGSGTSKGNGDGRIQRGESIDLVILMKNVGEGDAARAFAKVQNKEGRFVYLKRGTANLKEIKAGQWLEGRFQFQVKDSLAADAITFDVLAGDASFLRRPADEIVLPVAAGPAPTVTAGSGQVQVRPGAAATVRTAGEERAAALATVKPGAILEVTGRLNGWTRIKIPFEQGALPGWLPDTVLQASPSGALAAAEGLQPVFGYVPPTFVLPVATYSLPTVTRDMELTGQIKDDGNLSSLYVFVNNKKRHLRAFTPGDMKSGPDGHLSVPVSFKLPLEEGTNAIEVYAEDTSGLKSFEFFQVYRAPSSPTSITGKAQPGEAGR